MLILFIFYQGYNIKNIQSIFKQILESIDFLHSKMKIIHTDLKVKIIKVFFFFYFYFLS